MIDSRMPNKLSFFESMCALAFVAFAEFPVDVGILECGMGGEWDSTNVINADVSVITPIGFDHMEYLGDTLEKIALTKSGIIKESSFAVLARQEPEVAQVLMHKCAQVDATPIREGIEYSVKNRALAVGGQLISIAGVYGEYNDLFLPLHGSHQASNAATAIAAVEVFVGESKLDEDILREALANATSPGRCEIVMRNPTVIIDAAHNPHGAQSLKRTISEEFDFESIIGVIAPMGDKDVDGILEELESVVHRVIVSKNSSHRAADISELQASANSIFGNERVTAIESLQDALMKAMEHAKLENGVNDSSTAVLVAGSVVTAGEARGIIRRIKEKR
jgi:dihydrofolate synthase/folylpolyglutamate synthase